MTPVKRFTSIQRRQRIYSKASSPTRPINAQLTQELTSISLLILHSLTLSYIIQSDICYLCLTSKSYPKQLAFQYLEQLHTEFFASHGHRVSMFSRPYQAIAFGKIALNFLLKDPTLNRIRKEFIDPRSPDNLAKLNDNLTDIHDIMRKNIREVLHRGEKLDTMQTQASHLATASKKFKKDAEWANFMALVNAYIPFVAIAVIVLFVLYWRFA